MQRERIALTVMVDLDPIPGMFHEPSQAQAAIQAMLLSRIGHYNPVVVVGESEPPAPASLSPEQEINAYALQLAMRRHPDADRYELAREARKYADGIRRGF